MNEANIGCAIHYPTPLPSFESVTIIKKHQKGDFPIAEKLCSEIISLPMFAELKKEEVDQVCEVINEVVIEL